MTTETHTFQAEVSRLLDIVAHSLYSEREVFLRELISNASDACDRVRYDALTTPALLGDDTDLKITLTVDKDKRILTLTDNGIGMSKDELVGNLGTIARSGTGEFLKNTDLNDKPSLIGQFGVGFYSAFMVADEVRVTSRKAGSDAAWQWVSNGRGSFTIEEMPADAAPRRGTSIAMLLKEGAEEFMEEARLQQIVGKYSDHIAFPIQLIPSEGEPKTLNTASALWLRSAKDITPEQYTEFYHHNAHAFDAPSLTLHWHAEGTIDYRALLFVPSVKPMDLFDPARRHHVKLYARRVFITDAADGLLPPYLRFVKGVVDSEDLPLNVSREMLQHNPVLAKMKSSLTKRILGDLAKEARDESKKESYATFWNNFGAVLKEGIYEDKDHQPLLMKLCRFHTTKTLTATSGDEGAMIDLDTYISRMKEGQTAIYTISGSNLAQLATSPQLEGFKARDIEVLLLTDPVDDFWTSSVENYAGKIFQSVTRGAAADLDKIQPAEKPAEEPKTEALEGLLKAMKETLGDAVSDVRPSSRLTSSAVCLVAGDSDIDMNLERLLRMHKQLPQGVKRVLEINPSHPLIQQIKALHDEGKESLPDMCWLLLDQARILEGEPLPDPVSFATRMSSLLSQGLKAA